MVLWRAIGTSKDSQGRASVRFVVNSSVMSSVPETWTWSSLANDGAHRKIIGAPRWRITDPKLGHY